MNDDLTSSQYYSAAAQLNPLLQMKQEVLTRHFSTVRDVLVTLRQMLRDPKLLREHADTLMCALRGMAHECVGSGVLQCLKYLLNEL